ncbi:MAG: translation elongation factor Ts [Bacteroidales bacterium]|nr:translation elongation factor Ts [Bacteroidales bacterium]MCF8333299.1 translation elongation factor Ts [Bacteroidales bacterium]
MAKISAQDVNKLRQMTGAGMMDCKKALQEVEGDFDQAVEILRKKGQKVANKRADRSANEGIVIAKTTDDKKYGAIMMLNCETDFVAKNDDFVNFAYKIIDSVIVNKPSSMEDLNAMKLDNDLTVEENITDMIGKTGEKLVLYKFDALSSEKVFAYNHHGNKLGAIVAFNKDGSEEIDNAGHEIAMQIAAMNPAGIDKDDVPQEVIDRELEIGRDQARQEGKPENIIEKIAEGKLNKFLKENTLLNQEFIREAKTPVKDYLQKVDKDLKVVDFRRYMLGE